LTSIGHRLFCNDAELRPFYDPFDILISSSDDPDSATPRGLPGTETVYRALYFFILSSIYEKTSGIRNVTRSAFLNEIDTMITLLFNDPRA
jgi:hypothetical protein